MVVVAFTTVEGVSRGWGCCFCSVYKVEIRHDLKSRGTAGEEGLGISTSSEPSSFRLLVVSAGHCSFERAAAVRGGPPATTAVEGIYRTLKFIDLGELHSFRAILPSQELVCESIIINKTQSLHPSFRKKMLD